MFTSAIVGFSIGLALIGIAIATYQALELADLIISRWYARRDQQPQELPDDPDFNPTLTPEEIAEAIAWWNDFEASLPPIDDIDLELSLPPVERDDLPF